MTDKAKRYAEVYLEACALGYAVAVENTPDDFTTITLSAARETLRGAGVRYAAALGSLDATERAELEALRRFHEGALALRGELARGERTSAAETIETLDALELMKASG